MQGAFARRSMDTEFHDRQSSNVRRVAHTTFCNLNHLLSDHFGKRIVAVNKTDCLAALAYRPSSSG